MTRKIPVIVGSADIISGVTSWTFQLKEAFKGHHRYEIILFEGQNTRRGGRFDLSAPDATTTYQIIDSLAPAVVVPNFVWMLCPIGLNQNIRCIGICHADSEVEYYAPLSWYEPLIAKFIAVSPECTQKLANRLPGRADDITTLVYGVSVPTALERSYHANPIRLIYGGRIIQQQKRIFDFIPFVENLLELKVDFVLDIVGDGPDLPTLKKGMLKVAHGGRVRFHGRQHPEAMPDIWRRHDVFVQVSDFEGTSVSMLEAMAQGTVPVITTTSSGAENVITHAKNGFLLPVGDMRTMAQTIGDLASRLSVLRQVGQAAFHNAKQFSIQAYTETFSAIIDQALSSPPGNWPYERCLMPPLAIPISSTTSFETQQELLNHFSSEELAERIPIRKMIEAIGFKLSNQPGLSWLHRFRG